MTGRWNWIKGSEVISGSFGKKVYVDVDRGGQSGHINIISFGDQCNRLKGTLIGCTCKCLVPVS